MEYWQNPDPASKNTTRRCAADGEDPECSTAIRRFLIEHPSHSFIDIYIEIVSTGVNVAHWTYFGILAIQPFCIADHDEISH